MKRIVIACFQIGITILLLWWIFRDQEKRASMLVALRTAEFSWFLPGVLAIGISGLLQTERWRLLMAAQHIALGWWRTFRLYLIGAFFNLFLLGATGGDIVKVALLMRETPSRKSGALLRVVVDRMMGLLGVVAVAAMPFPLRLELLLSTPVTRTLVITVVALLGASFAIFTCGFLVYRFELGGKLPRRLPFRSRILKLSEAFSTYARRPLVLVQALAISIASHLCTFLAFYMAAQAFGQFPGIGGVLDVFSVLPAILTVAALPISLSGMGVREQLFQDVFRHLFGTPDSISVMISITGFLMIVFWGLVGGVAYLIHRPGEAIGGLDYGKRSEAGPGVPARIGETGDADKMVEKI